MVFVERWSCGNCRFREERATNRYSCRVREYELGLNIPLYKIMLKIYFKNRIDDEFIDLLNFVFITIYTGV